MRDLGISLVTDSVIVINKNYVWFLLVFSKPCKNIHSIKEGLYAKRNREIFDKRIITVFLEPLQVTHNSLIDSSISPYIRVI